MDPALRYEMINLIATGDFAAVYRARDRELGREVAVKQIHQQFLADPRQLERYWREAQLLASLQHPNVLTIYDVVRPRGWLILELMRGSLQSYAAGEPIDLDYLRIVLICCLHALQFLHANGIVHGDVKPSNMLVDVQNRVKLGDFGLARRASNEQGSLLKGTTKYMAPELVSPQFGRPGPASDLYALGFSAYELMCGRQFESLFPSLATFGRDRQIAWLMWHSAPDRKLPEIHRVLEGVPEDLARVVQGMIVKDPAGRYASAQEVLRDLRTAPVSTGMPDELMALAAEAEARRARKKRRWVLGAIFGVAFFLAVSAMMLLRTKPEPGSLPQPEPVRGVVRNLLLDERILVLERSDTGQPEEITLRPRDEVFINDKKQLLRDLQPGDRATIEIYRDAEGHRIQRIAASRPQKHQGQIEALQPDQGKITVALGSEGERLVIQVPKDVAIVFNGQKQLAGRPVGVADLKVGDRVTVGSLREETGLVATELSVERVVTAEGTLRDLAAGQLTFEAAGGKLVTLPLAQDCVVTINQRSEIDGQLLKPKDLKPGDKVTISHDLRVVRVVAYRTLGQGGVVKAVHDEAHSLEVVVAGQERPARFLVGPRCKITLAGDPARLADLRPGDMVDMTHDTPGAANPEVLTIAALRPPDPSRWALLVAVQNYEDRLLTRLPYPLADAALVQQVLVKRYRVPAEQAVLLADPSQVRLEQGTTEFLKPLKPDDEVIGYFAGHAYRDEDGTIYLAPANFSLARIAATGVRLSWVLEQFEKCPARKKLLLLDTSNTGSGGDLRTQPSTAEMIESLKTSSGRLPLRSVTAIASSSPGQRGNPWPEKEHGLFAYCLAEGFSGDADTNRDSRIDTSELFALLKSSMASASTAIGRTQTPRLFLPDQTPPRLSDEAKEAIRKLASFLQHEKVDVLDVNLQYAIAQKLAGKELEPKLLYGLLLMKARQRTEAHKHFSELGAAQPDLLLPEQAVAWLEFEKRTYPAGIEALTRLIARLPKPRTPGEPLGEEAARIVAWAGRLREFAALAVEENVQAPAGLLAKLDAAVTERGLEAQRLYEQGRAETHTALDSLDNAMAEAKDEATRARLRIERRQLTRYATFPFREISQGILAGLDREQPAQGVRVAP